MKSIVRKTLVGGAVLLAILLAGGIASFLYLRNSEWWITVTLFSDDTRVENFRNFHTLFPSDRVDPATDVWEFDHDIRMLPETFVFNDEERSVAGFLEETWTTGLSVAVDGTIVVEEYYRGYDATSLPTSFSMAKSVLSALVGIAIEEGHIRSVHDRVDVYLPDWAGTDYGAVSIQDLLTMSSGLEFDEDYESFTSDINMLPVRVFGFRDAVPDLIRDTEAVRKPGIYNEYVSSDSIVLGLVVEAAVGRSLSQYLEETVWGPAGMEYPAHWNTDYHGNTLGHAFFSASLRDYLRLGRLYLNGGERDERKIIPAGWVADSLYRDEPRLQPGDNPKSSWSFGYGYKWWIPEEPEGDFVAIGIWGQYIYVHPEYRVVISKTSADGGFDERDHETIALFRELARWASSRR
ncbi:MAG: serine hydrolase [Spirochaetes bacterium]|jgi:CubicO group peptidase (beta-lactamase class C family)|nr:serine hydrolase [Spirochaetota bacterium]